MRFGVAPLLEAEADRLIRESLKGVRSFAAKADVLTPWKEWKHRSREVYSATGLADPAVAQGMYGRALNPSRPELNSRDGVTPRPRGTARPRGNSRNMGSLEAFVAENSTP